ncbi:DnaJ-domain-containing protein [Meredithblackwellia eburnea MCA 4105]
MTQAFPDYYEILGVNENATPDQIKTAYKRKSLQTHPDRVPAGPGSDARRRAATLEFQAVSDAYYTLSDSTRRSNYDRVKSTQSKGNRSADAGSSSSYFDFFSQGTEEQPDAEHVFGNVFEDMMRPEVQRVFPLWTWTGAAAGAVMGFIVGNIPGAAIGGYGGSRLGAIRDAKGKAVYQVFKDLGADQKAEVLKGLAAQVFGLSAGAGK